MLYMYTIYVYIHKYTCIWMQKLTAGKKKGVEELRDFVMYRLCDICKITQIYLCMVGKTNCRKKKAVEGLRDVVVMFIWYIRKYIFI